MDDQLLTLSKIFVERLFRIPDYQRGYAWTERQLMDFWNDINQLETNQNHYTGVLTLEGVPEEVYKKWEDDLWIIEAKSYQPFFIVDGQQRLTTAIILIQSILERIQDTDKLNYTAKSGIQQRFIYDNKDEGISRSYIFGYEKDNPSYEFLKTRVFCEQSSSRCIEETMYTQNLANAKEFFSQRISSFTVSELEILYKKITQNLLFNIFTITEDVDVCVAFETMNNRGKPLSNLELLKNRLIYLSIKIDAEPNERKKLRKSINDCWKALYYNIGRNKDNPLRDDEFLFLHYITYFGKSLFEKIDYGRSKYYEYRYIYMEDGYFKDLLEKRFIPKNVLPSAPNESKIELNDIYGYVSSLQDSIELWYKIRNPLKSGLGADVETWLDKLDRLGASFFQPLILVFLQKEKNIDKRVLFLKAVERLIFITTLTKYKFWPYRSVIDINPEITELALDLKESKKTPDVIIKKVTDWTENNIKETTPRTLIQKFGTDGFYDWSALRYFLFEYNLDLQCRSKTSRAKIDWPAYFEDYRDFITVEHIYPKKANYKYWTSRFGEFGQKHRKQLRDSLGNLLPLSKPKNSSLSNKPFPEKVDGTKDHIVGYRYGSYAENEVSKEKEWTPKHILERGLRMLSFMEKRWNIPLGSESEKKQMLGLGFMNGSKKAKNL